MKLPGSRWTPEPAAELIRLGRAGERWSDIGAYFDLNAASACQAYKRLATPADRAARREALQANRHNRPREYSNHGMGGGRTGRREPPLQRERQDPFDGMGECFA